MLGQQHESPSGRVGSRQVYQAVNRDVTSIPGRRWNGRQDSGITRCSECDSGKVVLSLELRDADATNQDAI